MINMKHWSSNGHCSDANTWTYAVVETLNERILCVRIFYKTWSFNGSEISNIVFFLVVMLFKFVGRWHLEEYADSSQRLKWVGSEIGLVIWGSYKEGDHGIQGKGVSCSLLPFCVLWPFLQLPWITKHVAEHTHLILEDRGSIFLWNISIHSQNYTVSQPIRPAITITTVKTQNLCNEV